MRETSRFFSWCSCTSGGAAVASLACGVSFLVASGAEANNAACCDCVGDFNGDLTVDGADLGVLLAAWNTPGTAGNDFCEDIDGSGNVDGADLGLLLANWNTCTPGDGERCEVDPCPFAPADITDECCAAVCAVDPFCCSVAWDGICANEAITICGGGGDCPFAPPEISDECCAAVCAVDPFCCSVAWDGICANEAITICGGGGDCPFAPPEITEECCAAVCAVDPFCCSVAWDGICAGEAFSICGIGSACPFAPPEITEECCALVCSIDPFCCSVAWDSICAGEANSFCTGPCEFSCEGTSEGEACGDDTNGGCNAPIIGDSDCCFANGGIGCDDDTCESIVCSVDPFCCSVAWDGICAAEAVSFCPDTCQIGGQNFGSISCGETVCAEAWADGNFRDTDWYVFENNGGPQTVTLTLSGTLPMIFGKLNSTDCATVTQILPFATTGFCGTNSVSFCAAAGTNWLFAAPNSFSGFPCGSGNNSYSLSLECTGVECDPFSNPACPNPAHSCFETGTPGCSDEDCCNTVCNVDSFCCSVAWDGICVNEAFSLCGTPDCEFSCEGTPEGEACGDDTNGGCNAPIIGTSDCCFASGGIGCDDDTCEAAVCSVDPFCCSVAWDSICAAEAVSFCPDTCQIGAQNFGSISCGETVCATAWADGNFRDTDWYIYTNTTGSLQSVTLSVSSTLPMIFGKINSIDCATASSITPFATTGFCGTGSVTFNADPGDNWVFAAPNGFSGFPCGSNNDYSLTLECGGAGDPCPFAPSNITDECCAIVCAADPFCCNVAWDSICANEAITLCGGGSGSNCCIPNGGIGCDDQTCQDAVCAADAFCCSVAWDGLCSGAANNICAVCQ